MGLLVWRAARDNWLAWSVCGQVDELTARGYTAEAKRLLFEAALFEPQAEFVRDRLKEMP